MAKSNPNPPEVLDALLGILEKVNPRFKRPDAGKRQIPAMRVAVSSRIAQLIMNPAWQSKGGCTESEWRAAPRTLPKTLQELVTAPEDRMIFGRGEDVSSAINAIVIDPTLLTPQFLRDLGLEDFVPVKGERHSAQEKAKSQADAIPAVRQMLHHLEPVKLPQQRQQDLRYFRLMRVAAGQNEGAVVGTQKIDGQKTLFKTDLYGALRRILHIEAGYVGEIEKLKLIQWTLQQVIEKLGEWTEAKGQTQELRAELESVVKSLQFVHDEHKKCMRAQVAGTLTFEDRTGRPNPGRSMAKLTAASGSLDKRIQSVERIWRYLGEDKARVQGLIKAQEAPMNGFLEVTEQLHDRFSILKDQPLGADEKRKVLGNLRRLQASVAEQKFEPHLSFGRKLSGQIDKVIAELGPTGSRENARKEFVKIYLLAKILRCHNELRTVYEKLSLSPGDIEPNQLLGEVEQIHDELRAKRVAQGVSTKEYDDAYGEVYHILNGIKKRLRDVINSPECVAESSQKPPKENEFTLKSVVARLRKIPLLGSVLDTLKGRLGRLLDFASPAAAEQPMQEPQLVEVQKQPDPAAVQAVYGAIREKLKKADFIEIISGL